METEAQDRYDKNSCPLLEARECLDVVKYYLDDVLFKDDLPTDAMSVLAGRAIERIDEVDKNLSHEAVAEFESAEAIKAMAEATNEAD